MKKSYSALFVVIMELSSPNYGFVYEDFLLTFAVIMKLSS